VRRRKNSKVFTPDWDLERCRCLGRRRVRTGPNAVHFPPHIIGRGFKAPGRATRSVFLSFLGLIVPTVPARAPGST
jgi:hypothetical protein